MYVGMCFSFAHIWGVFAEARVNGSSETGVMVGYELPDTDAGNRTWVHWKSSKYS